MPYTLSMTIIFLREVQSALKISTANDVKRMIKCEFLGDTEAKSTEKNIEVKMFVLLIQCRATRKQSKSCEVSI